MRLARALRLSDGEVVALTGAGGKSAALFRLADDVVEQGGRVVSTVTTHLAASQLSRAPRHFSAMAANRAAVAAALEKHAHVLVTGPVDPAVGKAAGVSAGLVEDLHAIPNLAAILIEADGARQLPFKAPAEHEPAIPPTATLVVVVAGLSALGRPLIEGQVHRPERIAALSGLRPGEPLTPEAMARVMGHPQGGLKGVPPDARVCVLLNQAEGEAELTAGRSMAARLLENPAIEAVLLGSARRPNAVREVHARAAAVILAAGRSTRMGRPKLLLPWAGTTVIGEVVRRVCQTAVSDVVVVTGAERDAVAAAVAAAAPGDSRVRWVFNPEYAGGEMARSLRAGLAALPGGRWGALAVLGDQPWIEPPVAAAVLQRWRETLAPAVAPVFAGRRGHPLLLDRDLWPALRALPAQANPREILQAAGGVEAVAVETDSILRDLDTPDDYAAAAAGP